jgi:hypothetical protein
MFVDRVPTVAAIKPASAVIVGDVGGEIVAADG